MKKMNTAEMKSTNAGAYRCSLCNKFIATYFGCGVHAYKHPGKKAYIFKIW